MFWIPKMHKNPTGACFITASKICSRKQTTLLFPISLSSYNPKSKMFIKMLNSYEIITSFGFYKIQFNSIIKSINNITKKVYQINFTCDI